jgi:hypothetical protein
MLYTDRNYPRDKIVKPFITYIFPNFCEWLNRNVAKCLKWKTFAGLFFADDQVTSENNLQECVSEMMRSQKNII